MRYSRADRQAHVELWRESGLSRAAYCRAAGLNYQTFISWVRSEPESIICIDQPSGEDDDPGQGFIEVQPARPLGRQPVGDALRMDAFGGSVRLEVDADVPDACLSRLIAAVRAC